MRIRAHRGGFVLFGLATGLLAWAGCSSGGDTATGTTSAGAGTSGNGGASTTGGPTTTGNGSGTTTGNGGATSTTTSSTSASTGTGGGIAGKRPWPDSWQKISILADQLPNLSPQQQQFVVDHFVGTEKQTLAQSMPLRALKPDFLVLHYHLAIWQSAPAVDFIIDGKTWGNNYPMVTTHESWFWHNTSMERIQSNVDDKYLMNLGDAGFRQYWEDSFIAQMIAGDYDGVMADSASPALLNFEAQSPPEPRLVGTGVKDTPIPELGGKTYIEAWQDFMIELNAALDAKGLALIPNVSAFTTTWDNTNYDLTTGIFSEGFANPTFAEADWKASTSEILKIVEDGKIVILQNYLAGAGDLAKRRYYLANYLLVKGAKTYLDYFAGGPMEWYPEWGLDLGAATKTANNVDDLASAGVYRRDFAKGVVLINPSGADVMVTLGATYQRVEPMGGGAVDASGVAPGTLGSTPVTTINVPAHGAEILTK